ncbi:MAG: C_GCAxxG_C_C family protein [Ruminiclostridium sp.]|nr:C_GCAxxG_C_C family protein [Ruminiclostridium sp.]
MSEKVEKAINNHKNFYPCSAAVLCAFSDEAGLSEQEAKQAAMPMAGGKMGKCGAVLAAEYVLEKKLGSDAVSAKAEFEKRFTEMNRTLMCKELKGALTGKIIRSCRGCVTDAAEILADILERS